MILLKIIFIYLEISYWLLQPIHRFFLPLSRWFLTYTTHHHSIFKNMAFSHPASPTILHYTTSHSAAIHLVIHDFAFSLCLLLPWTIHVFSNMLCVRYSWSSEHFYIAWSSNSWRFSLDYCFGCCLILILSLFKVITTLSINSTI